VSTSWMTTMFSWLHRAVARASVRNRLATSGRSVVRNFIATRRPRRVSRARRTQPIPPRPSSRMIWYWCTCVPGANNPLSLQCGRPAQMGREVLHLDLVAEVVGVPADDQPGEAEAANAGEVRLARE